SNTLTLSVALEPVVCAIAAGLNCNSVVRPIATAVMPLEPKFAVGLSDWVYASPVTETSVASTGVASAEHNSAAHRSVERRRIASSSLRLSLGIARDDEACVMPGRQCSPTSIVCRFAELLRVAVVKKPDCYRL